MRRIDIAVIRSNSTEYDPRVKKIVKSLRKKYATSIIGWESRWYANEKTENHGTNVRLFGLRAPVGTPSLLLYLPLFWMWVLVKLFEHRPKVVHACDLDTVIPSFVYKLIFRKKLVFDVFDRYAMAYVPKKFSILYSMVNLTENWFAKHADLLITVSTVLLSTFRGKLRQSAIIMNCPEELLVDLHEPGVGVFTLVYTGAVVKNRGLEKISAAITDISDVQLKIAGRVIDDKLFEHLSSLSNIQYKGLLLPKDALLLEAEANAMVILYDLNDPINNFAMPNKVFEAMMFGLPVISNVASEMISTVGCGIMVDYNDICQIKRAVIILRDNLDMRKHLGSNGRRAFLQKYNWTVMENELFRCYETIIM